MDAKELPLKLSLERSKKRAQLRKTLYQRRFIVPNAVTVANMFCGFLAIVYAASNRYEKAAIAIGFAILLDGLDGRVARRLNATSRFGVEFDSLSDVVSFGLAPAILVYHWCFQVPADEFGVLVTFIYTICAASRLARFNISEGALAKFNGLPSPGAAAAVAAVVHCVPNPVITTWLLGLMTVFLTSLAYLMVSNIEYFSIKQLKFKTFPLVLRIALGVLIPVLWYNNKIGLLFFGLAYAFSGPVALIFTRFRAADEKLVH